MLHGSDRILLGTWGAWCDYCKTYISPPLYSVFQLYPHSGVLLEVTSIRGWHSIFRLAEQNFEKINLLIGLCGSLNTFYYTSSIEWNFPVSKINVRCSSIEWDCKILSLIRFVFRFAFLFFTNQINFICVLRN